MLEKDYYDIALKHREKDLMDEYWENIARSGKWISKDGTETYFRDLDLKHLLNIINGLLDFENKNCKMVVKRLIQELTVRATRKTPKYAFEALDKLTETCISHTLTKEEEEEIEDLKDTVLTFLK